MISALDKLQTDLKLVADALGQVHRTLAEARQELTVLRKQAEGSDALKDEVSKLKDRLAKITSFISGAA